MMQGEDIPKPPPPPSGQKTMAGRNKSYGYAYLL